MSSLRDPHDPTRWADGAPRSLRNGFVSGYTGEFGTLGAALQVGLAHKVKATARVKAGREAGAYSAEPVVRRKAK